MTDWALHPSLNVVAAGCPAELSANAARHWPETTRSRDHPVEDQPACAIDARINGVGSQAQKGFTFGPSPREKVSCHACLLATFSIAATSVSPFFRVKAGLHLPRWSRLGNAPPLPVWVRFRHPLASLPGNPRGASAEGWVISYRANWVSLNPAATSVADSITAPPRRRTSYRTLPSVDTPHQTKPCLQTVLGVSRRLPAALHVPSSAGPPRMLPSEHSPRPDPNHESIATRCGSCKTFRHTAGESTRTHLLALWHHWFG